MPSRSLQILAGKRRVAWLNSRQSRVQRVLFLSLCGFNFILWNSGHHWNHWKPFGPVKRIQKELQEETQWLTFCNLDLCWSYVSKILGMIISNRASHFLWGFFSTFPGLKVFYLTSFHKSLRKTRPVSIQRPPQQRQPQQPQSQELDPNQQRPKKHEVQTSCNNAMILGESLLVLWFRQQPNSEKNWNSPSDPSHPRTILRCFVSRPMHEFIRPEEKEKKLKSFANPKSPSDSEISIQI